MLKRELGNSKNSKDLWLPFTEFQFIDASERALGWRWIFDTLSIPDIRTTSTYIFSDTGYQEVTLIVEDQYGCFDTLTQKVDVVQTSVFFQRR